MVSNFEQVFQGLQFDGNFTFKLKVMYNKRIISLTVTSSFDAFSDIVPTIDENQLTVDPNSYLESSRCTYVVNEKFKV